MKPVAQVEPKSYLGQAFAMYESDPRFARGAPGGDPDPESSDGDNSSGDGDGDDKPEVVPTPALSSRERLGKGTLEAQRLDV